MTLLTWWGGYDSDKSATQVIIDVSRAPPEVRAVQSLNPASQDFSGFTLLAVTH